MSKVKIKNKIKWSFGLVSLNNMLFGPASFCCGFCDCYEYRYLCSAGCGRTGTLIGIDIARAQLLSKVRSSFFLDTCWAGKEIYLMPDGMLLCSIVVVEKNNCGFCLVKNQVNICRLFITNGVIQYTYIG